MEAETEQADNLRDVIDETPTYTLAGTNEGWGVWDRTDPSGQPAVFYPPTDDGFELASGYFERANRAATLRHGPWLDILRNAAFVAGGAWIAASTIDNLRFATSDDPFQLERASSAFRWVQALENTAYSVFLVAVAAYVLLWLRGHQRP